MELVASILSRESGIKITVNKPAMSEVHAYWLASCGDWLKELDDSKQLSHLKKSAALFTQLHNVEPFRSDDTIEYAASRGLSFAQDILESGFHLIEWMIVYKVCDRFERNRDDKKTDYIPCMTQDFTHDLMKVITSGKMNERSFHIVLKALFIRGDKP